MSRPLLLFTPGAVLLRDLVSGLGRCDAVLFVCDEDAVRSGVTALLSAVGEVHVHDGDLTATVDRARSFGVDGVITFAEAMLPLAAELADRMALPFNSPDVVHRLRDKSAQRAALASAGVEDVAYRTVTTADACRDALSEVGLPAVLKPVAGAGSKDTYLVSVDSQVEEIFAGLEGPTDRAFQVEEFLVGVRTGPFAGYVSVESMISDNGIEHLGVTGKLPQLPPFRETGQFHPPNLGSEVVDDILTLTERALEALGVTHGQTHTELILTARGPRIVEVNGRLGGYINELYSRVYATDLVERCVRVACGEDVDPLRPVQPGVHYQYYHQPPRSAGRLLEVTGQRSASRAAGVVRYDRIVAPGTDMPDDASSFDLDLLGGWASTHESFLEDLARAQGGLEFTFEVIDGGSTTTATLSGIQLAGGWSPAENAGP